MTSNNRIAALRQQIDLVDADIINLLAGRKSLVNVIFEEKNKENMSIEQPERFAEILKSRSDIAKNKGLSVGFIKKLYTLIHDESVSAQKDKS